MLVENVGKLDEEHLFVEPHNCELHKRMPHKMERQLLGRFEEYKAELLKGS